MRVLESKQSSFGNATELVARPIIPRRRPVPYRKLGMAIFLVGAIAGLSTAYPLIGIAILLVCAAVAVVVLTVRQPSNGLIVALCCFPVYPTLRALLTVYRIPFDTAGLRFWAEGVLLLTFVAILIHRVRNRERLLFAVDDLPALAWICYVLYGATISLLSQNILFTIFGLHFALVPPLFYLIARWCRPTETEKRRIIAAFFLTYSLLAIVSLVELVTLPQIGLRLADAARPELADVSGFSDRLLFWRLYARMQSLLWEENVWGSLCSLVSLLAVARLVNERKSPLSWIVMLLATGCMVLTVSRGSMGGWLVGMAVLLLMRTRYRRRLHLLLVVAAIAAGILLQLFATDPRVQMITTIAERSGLNRGRFGDDRWQQWQSGLDIFLRNPSGTGIGTVGYGASKTGIALSTVADGNYLSALAETGVPGMLLIVVSLIGVGILLLRHLRRGQPHSWLGMGLLAYLCATSLHAISANTFEYYYTFPVFWMLVGIYTAPIVPTSAQKG